MNKYKQAQHRRPKAAIAGHRHDTRRYHLAPGITARLVLWLALRGLDRREYVLSREDLITMLLDWDMVKRDRSALQSAMAGTKIPEQFPLTHTADYLLVFMVRVAADDLLAVAP